MPKVLDHPKEKILAAAREILLHEGYDALTVRNIAAKVHVAAGTVYNYFPSKDHLCAGVMLEDWQRMMREMHNRLKGTDGKQGIRIIYETVKAYAESFEPVFGQYHGAAITRSSYHDMLVNEIASYIREVLPDDRDAFLPVFLSETILRFAAGLKTPYEKLENIIAELIQEEESL